jgi:hypothetical protein
MNDESRDVARCVSTAVQAVMEIRPVGLSAWIKRLTRLHIVPAARKEMLVEDLSRQGQNVGRNRFPRFYGVP